ncbi:MAG: rod shape-determining protein MreC [bacterium]|nr:rod shape-determining protein MreC [bacterium]
MRTRTLLFSSLAGVVLLVLIGRSNVAGNIGGIGYLAISPLVKIGGAVADGLKGFSGYFADKRYLLETNRLLKRQNEALKIALAVYEDAYLDNRHLRKLMDLSLPETAAIYATVTGRDGQVIYIDKGYGKGVRTDQIVVSPERAVVGRVVAVYPAGAKVMGITDERSYVGAVVSEDRYPCVMHGTGRGKAELLYLPIESAARIGSGILTSGMGGVYPRGLMLGRISSMIEDKHTMMRKAVVASSSRPELLKEVMVLKQ